MLDVRAGGLDVVRTAVGVLLEILREEPPELVGLGVVCGAICPGRLRIEPLVWNVVAALRDVEAEKRFGFELGTREATVEMIGSRCDIGDACCVLWATAWRLEPRMGYDGLA